MIPMLEGIPVCKATLEDIRKAFRVKLSLSIEQVGESLPVQVKDFIHLSAEDMGAK